MDGRFREIQMFKDDMCGGKRGVPTQINFALRGKPTQLEAILIGDKKAVSDWLCCCDIFNNISSGNQSSSGHTAAALPPNVVVVKASTM